MDFLAKSKMKGDADAFLVKEREEEEKGEFDLGKEGGIPVRLYVRFQTGRE